MTASALDETKPPARRPLRLLRRFWWLLAPVAFLGVAAVVPSRDCPAIALSPVVRVVVPPELAGTVVSPQVCIGDQCAFLRPASDNQLYLDGKPAPSGASYAPISFATGEPVTVRFTAAGAHPIDVTTAVRAHRITTGGGCFHPAAIYLHYDGAAGQLSADD